MNNPYYCADRILNTAFDINLYSYHINNIYSKVFITPKILEIEKKIMLIRWWRNCPTFLRQW